MEKIIGRETEKMLLAEILTSGSSELLALYGRRRVGKTFLIRNTFEKQLAFEFSGIHNALLDQQLENFSKALSKAAGLPIIKPGSWIQAFTMLEDYLAVVVICGSATAWHDILITRTVIITLHPVIRQYLLS